MVVVSLKTGVHGGVEFLKIELEDGSFLYIKSCYLADCPDVFASVEEVVSLEEGKEIPPDKEEALRFADVCYRAERAGMGLIARAEQTQAGLFRKLERRGYDSACVSVVMACFVESDLVNDERYAEYWLRSRLARKNGKIRGPRRLSAALGSRGIGKEAQRGAFDKALDEEAEFELLQRFLSKNRVGGSGIYTLRGRLRYEGFSSPVINRYFDETAGVNSLF